MDVVLYSTRAAGNQHQRAPPQSQVTPQQYINSTTIPFVVSHHSYGMHLTLTQNPLALVLLEVRVGGAQGGVPGEQVPSFLVLICHL